jgi:predicted dehydrogenase
MMKKIVFSLLSCLLLAGASVVQAQKSDSSKVLRLGVIGLVHDHVHWILNRKGDDVKIVGIVETNASAISKMKARYSLPDSLFFESYEALMKYAKPEAVSAFNETDEHLEVAAYFLPKKIPVMVEKPMATSLEAAEKMAELSRRHNTPLLVNYETSWYESTYETQRMVQSGEFGALTKMVFNTGHMGPIEIGCSPEFLEWLTDPIKNGAGALTDFGCYGANLATWMLNQQTPESVTAISKQTKPLIYPRVDDDNTILLNYPNLQVVIQASWNWTHHRKDMEVYLNKASIYALDATRMRLLDYDSGTEHAHKPQAIEAHLKDPFRLLYEMEYEGRTLEASSLYGLENNLIVSKILELARRSAAEGHTIKWNEG